MANREWISIFTKNASLSHTRTRIDWGFFFFSRHAFIMYTYNECTELSKSSLCPSDTGIFKLINDTRDMSHESFGACTIARLFFFFLSFFFFTRKVDNKDEFKNKMSALIFRVT